MCTPALWAAAKATALSAGRQRGAPSVDAPRLAALFASQLRRAWGVTVVREMARHCLIRVPFIGAPRGTRLSQALAPVAYATATAWDVHLEPLGPPGVNTSQGGYPPTRGWLSLLMPSLSFLFFDTPIGI
jgi:hypothetical protein